MIDYMLDVLRGVMLGLGIGAVLIFLAYGITVAVREGWRGDDE